MFVYNRTTSYSRVTPPFGSTGSTVGLRLGESVGRRLVCADFLGSTLVFLPGQLRSDLLTGRVSTRLFQIPPKITSLSIDYVCGRQSNGPKFTVQPVMNNNGPFVFRDIFHN